MGETKIGALKALDLFETTCAAKHGKAVTCLARDRDMLPAFYDFPRRAL